MKYLCGLNVEGKVYPASVIEVDSEEHFKQEVRARLLEEYIKTGKNVSIIGGPITTLITVMDGQLEEHDSNKIIHKGIIHSEFKE